MSVWIVSALVTPRRIGSSPWGWASRAVLRNRGEHPGSQSLLDMEHLLLNSCPEDRMHLLATGIGLYKSLVLVVNMLISSSFCICHCLYISTFNLDKLFHYFLSILVHTTSCMFHLSWNVWWVSIKYLGYYIWFLQNLETMNTFKVFQNLNWWTCKSAI